MKKLFYIGAMSALLLTACAGEKAEVTDNAQEESDKAKEKEAEKAKKEAEKEAKQKAKEEEKKAKKVEKKVKQEAKEAEKEEKRQAKEEEKKAKEEAKLKEEQAEKEKEAKDKAEKEAKEKAKTEAKAKSKEESKEADLTKDVTKLINKKIGKTNSFKKDTINSLSIKAKDLYVVLNGSESFTKNMTKKSMWLESKKILEPINKMNEFDSVTIQWYYPLVDTYGNEKDELVMSFDIDKTTLNKIKWDNFLTDNVPNVVNNYFEHAVLKE